MRAAFVQQLATIERRIEDEVERAAAMLADIGDAIQIPTAGNAAGIAEEGGRLYQACRSVDAQLVV